MWAVLLLPLGGACRTMRCCCVNLHYAILHSSTVVAPTEGKRQRGRSARLRLGWTNSTLPMWEKKLKCLHMQFAGGKKKGKKVLHHH